MKQEILLKLIEKLIDGESENAAASTQPTLIGQGVIVRCRDAGVHYGKLKSWNGREVILEDSRRMYRWWAKDEMSLSGVARHGINREKSQIAGSLSLIILLDACEIIPFSSLDAEQTIISSEVYNEQ